MPQFNGDVIFLDGSGQVRATNGSLTLRGDDTGNKAIIVGSGLALRPEIDVAMDLGRPDLKWHRLYTGFIESRSGILGDNQPAGSKLTFDHDNFEWDTASVQFVSSTVDFTNAQLILDSSSQLISNGFLDVLGTFRVRTDVDAVDGDISHRIGSPTSRFGYIYAGSGIFNALRPYTSGTFINVEGSLLPSRDALYSLGTSSSRWGTAHIASGIFNTIGASTSGTRIESAASFIPNRHNIYSLGTTGQRWANIFATSGTIQEFSATNVTGASASFTDATIRDLTLDRSLLLNVDGFQISQVGQTSWDLRGGTLDFSNGTVNFENISTSTGASIGGGLSTDTLNVTSTASITGTLSTRNIVPQTDRLYAIGTSALRYSRMHAASGIFNQLASSTSGTFIQSNASLVPEQASVYSLGTSALPWGNLFATSGTITTLSSTTIGAADITSTASLNALGSFGVLGLAVFNGGTFFGNAAAPTPDAAYPFGLQGLRWAQIYAVSGQIETINPLPSGGSLTVNGHIIPDRDDHRALGLTSRRWLRVNAASGNFVSVAATDVSASTGSFTSLSTDSLAFNNPGATITSENTTWNLTETDITFTDGTVLFDAPYDRAGFAAGRPKLNNAPLVTNKEARTTVHAVITANSGAIINSSAERDIYNYTIPADTLSASGKLTLECVGSVTNMAGANVNVTPRVYINGTAIWGDVLAVAQGPRAAHFALYTDICSLGSLTGQRVCGSVELGTRTAGSITGNGDFGTANVGGTWSSQAASGTVSFSSPVNIRVSMQLGTASTNASYSGFHCIMSHQPFPTI